VDADIRTNKDTHTCLLRLLATDSVLAAGCTHTAGGGFCAWPLLLLMHGESTWRCPDNTRGDWTPGGGGNSEAID
jgi:hypothetical protein